MIGVEGGSTEGFLAGFSLESLIAPEDLPEFLTTHWDRAPLLIKRGAADFYDGLTTLEEIDAAVAASAFRASYVDARDGEGRTWVMDPEDSTRPATGALLARLAEGATLILDHADRVLPGLGRMSRLLMAETGHAWHCNLYATPAGAQGFDAHVDDSGVFILQLLGRKHWTFGRDQIRRPVAGEGGSAAPEGWETGAEQARLAPGDMLYLPRGIAHLARASEGEPSLHVSLTVAEASWAALAGLESPATEADRDLLAIGFHRDPAELVQPLSLRHPEIPAERVATFLTEQARRFRPDLSGRFARAFKGPGVAPDTHLRPRKDLFWTITAADGQRHLICGLTRLTFPERAEPFVRTLLTRGGRIAEPLTDMADQTDMADADPISEAEQRAIAEILLQHGLIQRR